MKRLPRPYQYALTLIVGVLFVTPAAGIGLSAVGLPLTVVLLSVLAVVLGLYGIAAVLAEDTRLALTVSILVLATIGANVPLGPRPVGVTIGPDLFLVDVPLALLALISLSTWERRDFGAVHGLLVGYLIWSIALLALAPGQAVTLHPHTVRLVFANADGLPKPGDHFAMHLDFANAGELAVEVEVLAPRDAERLM